MTLTELAVLQAATDGRLARSERIRDRGCWYVGERDVTKDASSLLIRGLINVEATNGQVTTGVPTAAGLDALDKHRLAVVAETAVSLVRGQP